jgi:hypothetical protein
VTWKQGAREGKGRAQRQDRGRSSLERLRRPVRDQGGIKAGPRRDHLLFNLILTDYQLPTVFSSRIFSSYSHLDYYISRSSEILSKRLGEISYTGRVLNARLPAQGPCLSASAAASAAARVAARAAATASARISARAAACAAAAHIRDDCSQDTACCLFFYIR